MKYILNPNYRNITDFIKNIPTIFNTQGRYIYNERNQLKIYEINGYDVVVKSFHKPCFINQIIYGLFRSSKARRSYEYALELLKRGISTPDPIAYIEEKKFCLLFRSFYLCIYEKNAESIRDYMTGEKTDDALMEKLAAFVACMHKKGIAFLDMSPGNILCRQENSSFIFSLVDINRMKFKSRPLSENERYKNLKRLSNSHRTIENVISRYANICGLDPARAVRKVQKYSARFEDDYRE